MHFYLSLCVYVVNLCKLAPQGMSQWIYSIQLMIEALQNSSADPQALHKSAEKS